MLTKKLSLNVFETSHIFNKILLKILNSRIYRVERLNQTKFLNMD